MEEDYYFEALNGSIEKLHMVQVSNSSRLSDCRRSTDIILDKLTSMDHKLDLFIQLITEKFPVASATPDPVTSTDASLVVQPTLTSPASYAVISNGEDSKTQSEASEVNLSDGESTPDFIVDTECSNVDIFSEEEIELVESVAPIKRHNSSTSAASLIQQTPLLIQSQMITCVFPGFDFEKKSVEHTRYLMNFQTKNRNSRESEEQQGQEVTQWCVIETPALPESVTVAYDMLLVMEMSLEDFFPAPDAFSGIQQWTIVSSMRKFVKLGNDVVLYDLTHPFNPGIHVKDSEHANIKRDMALLVEYSENNPTHFSKILFVSSQFEAPSGERLLLQVNSVGLYSQPPSYSVSRVHPNAQSQVTPPICISIFQEFCSAKLSIALALQLYQRMTSALSSTLNSGFIDCLIFSSQCLVSLTPSAVMFHEFLFPPMRGHVGFSAILCVAISCHCELKHRVSEFLIFRRREVSNLASPVLCEPLHICLTIRNDNSNALFAKFDIEFLFGFLGSSLHKMRETHCETPQREQLLVNSRALFISGHSKQSHKSLNEEFSTISQKVSVLQFPKDSIEVSSTLENDLLTNLFEMFDTSLSSANMYTFGKLPLTSLSLSIKHCKIDNSNHVKIANNVEAGIVMKQLRKKLAQDFGFLEFIYLILIILFIKTSNARPYVVKCFSNRNAKAVSVVVLNYRRGSTEASKIHLHEVVEVEIVEVFFTWLEDFKSHKLQTDMYLNLRHSEFGKTTGEHY